MHGKIIRVEIGALPMGEDKHNQLVISSLLRRNPKDMDDKSQAKEIVEWLFRFIPAKLYNAILDEMQRRS